MVGPWLGGSSPNCICQWQSRQAADEVRHGRHDCVLQGKPCEDSPRCGQHPLEIVKCQRQPHAELHSAKTAPSRVEGQQAHGNCTWIAVKCTVDSTTLHCTRQQAEGHVTCRQLPLTIVSASTGVIAVLSNQSNAAGCARASKAAPRTKTGKKLVSVAASVEKRAHRLGPLLPLPLPVLEGIADAAATAVDIIRHWPLAGSAGKCAC